MMPAIQLFVVIVLFWLTLFSRWLTPVVARKSFYYFHKSFYQTRHANNQNTKSIEKPAV